MGNLSLLPPRPLFTVLPSTQSSVTLGHSLPIQSPCDLSSMPIPLSDTQIGLEGPALTEPLAHSCARASPAAPSCAHLTNIATSRGQQGAVVSGPAQGSAWGRSHGPWRTSTPVPPSPRGGAGPATPATLACLEAP